MSRLHTAACWSARLPTLAGQIEVRGLGIRRVAHEPVAVVGLVVELGTAAERLPEPAQQEAVIAGVRLPRLAVAAGVDPLLLLMAYIRTAQSIP